MRVAPEDTGEEEVTHPYFRAAPSIQVRRRRGRNEEMRVKTDGRARSPRLFLANLGQASAELLSERVVGR